LNEVIKILGIGIFKIQNTTDFIRNGYALTNLEKIRLKNSSLSNTIKDYVEGAKLISPPIKKIVDEQKKINT
jgi:hypothetical protein